MSHEPPITLTTTYGETTAAVGQAVSEVFSVVTYHPPDGREPPAELFPEHAWIHNLDLGHSVIARDSDGALVGIAVLGRRGEEGWCSDFGVVPRYRRLGIGHRLMAAFLTEARTLPLRRIRLETDARNIPAQQIYLRAGFTVTRTLMHFHARADDLPTGAIDAGLRVRDASYAEAIAWYLRHPGPAPAWERELPSLLALPGLGCLVADADGARAACLWYSRVYGGRADAPLWVGYLGMAPGARSAAAAALLHEACRREGKSLINVPLEPEGSPLSELLWELGFREIGRDYEMALDL